MMASALGWVGTIGSIAAYLMLSRGQWSARSLRYSALNGVAGVMAGTASAIYGAWPSAFSNLIWTVIAVHSILTTLRERRSPVATVTPLPRRDPPAQQPVRPLRLLEAA